MKILNKGFYFLVLLTCLFFISCEDSNTTERVSKMVEGINKKCPVLIDEETLFKQVSYDKQQTITYSYQLINYHGDKIDTATFRRSLWPGLLATIKVDAELKDLRDASFTFVYTYDDKTGKPICTFRIKAEHYNK